MSALEVREAGDLAAAPGSLSMEEVVVEEAVPSSEPASNASSTALSTALGVPRNSSGDSDAQATQADQMQCRLIKAA